MSGPADVLEAVSWRVCRTEPNAIGTPGELDAGPPRTEWLQGRVPATAAQVLASNHPGRYPHGVPTPELDSADWWWQCTLPPSAEPILLSCDGLATHAEIFLGDTLLGATANMFRPQLLELAAAPSTRTLTIAFRALAPRLSVRRPRPRWKSTLVEQQNLRWFRTSLLGRIPAWSTADAIVGPWRPITARPLVPGTVVQMTLAPCYDRASSTGHVDVDAEIHGPVSSVRLRIGGTEYRLPHTGLDGSRVRVRGSAAVPQPELWWPTGYGPQPLYDADLVVDDAVVESHRVGFRSVGVDRAEGRFKVRINDAPIFCSGAVWMPRTPAGGPPNRAELRTELERFVAAGLRMLRVPGVTTYESTDFYELCDELGILVWQDVMFASMDPPADPDFLADVAHEVGDLLGRLRHHPCLTVLCGGSEIEQQAAMLGLEAPELPVLTEVIPSVLNRVMPELPYVTSSPSGGTMPFHVGTGIAQYFGVGAYLRPLIDVRSAGVRFAAECLALAVPPETISAPLTPAMAGQHPRWKDGVPRDRTASWDFEDVRDFYVRTLFDVDPALVRYADPERYLDLGRAACVELCEYVFTSWRREGSGCSGGLVLSWRDVRAGAGWGLLDVGSAAKAPLLAMPGFLAPRAVFVTDDGLDGLTCHLVNDENEAVDGSVRLELFDVSGRRTEEVEVPAAVAPRSQQALSLDGMLAGFRDLNRVYRFGPAAVDAIAVRWLSAARATVAETVYLPLGPARDIVPDLGLHAVAESGPAGTRRIVVATEALAQRIVVTAPGWQPDRGWFHLAPGSSAEVVLRPLPGAPQSTRATIRALNCRSAARLELAASDDS